MGGLTARAYPVPRQATVNNEHSSVIAGDEPAAGWSHKTMRTALLFVFALSCAPPFIHFRVVDEVFESLRYPMGLLPGVYLFLRQFGQFSTVFPVAVMAGLGWSFFRPGHTARLLTAITSAFLTFAVAYLCWALVVIYLLAHNHAASNAEGSF